MRRSINIQTLLIVLAKLLTVAPATAATELPPPGGIPPPETNVVAATPAKNAVNTLARPQSPTQLLPSPNASLAPAIFATPAYTQAGASSVPPLATLKLPRCPAGSTQGYAPDAASPAWAFCKDANGLYQGFLFQLTRQKEFLRIAYLHDSIRDGLEIRRGEAGYLEERTFKGGRLEGKSFIFKYDAPLARIFPALPTQEEWNAFVRPTGNSLLKAWLTAEPYSTIEFKSGRMSHLQFAEKDYHFELSKDGRIFALDHPEMKQGFFIDSEPLTFLNAADLKAALLPGFGSCKKYSGPISRFGRHYDHILYKRDVNEKRHLEALKEIEDRFVNFCVPEDIRTHTGRLECPPQLPATQPANDCWLSYSSEMHIPYLPKYFKYEFTLGRAPDEMHEILREKGMPKVVSDYAYSTGFLSLTDKLSLQLKKGPHGFVYRPAEKDIHGVLKVKKDPVAGQEDDKEWFDWKRMPGY